MQVIALLVEEERKAVSKHTEIKWSAGGQIRYFLLNNVALHRLGTWGRGVTQSGCLHITGLSIFKVVRLFAVISISFWALLGTEHLPVGTDPDLCTCYYL